MFKKEAEKSLKYKYKDLTTEIQRMCNVNTKVVPVITGATGTVSKSIQTIPEPHTVKARHRGTTDNSHIGTAHVLREVLM